MHRPYDYATFFCTLGFVVANLFGLLLWTFGLFRTGFWFFYVLILSALAGVALSAINVIVYYDPQFMPRLLGAPGFALFFYVYTWLLLFNFVISLVGSAFMVRWICRAQLKGNHGPVV